MIWLAVSRVHDISRMGDHMIHIFSQMFILSNPATVTANGHGNPTGIALRISRIYLWLVLTADLILDVGHWTAPA